jgi:hypothetical protein
MKPGSTISAPSMLPARLACRYLFQSAVTADVRSHTEIMSSFLPAGPDD